MPSVESHQDILFDINSFGGFLNLLIYDFGNIDKQDPVFHFGRNFIFFHIIRQQDTLLELGNRRIHGARYFLVFLLLLLLVLSFPCRLSGCCFRQHFTLKSFLVIPGAAISTL